MIDFLDTMAFMTRFTGVDGKTYLLAKRLGTVESEDGELLNVNLAFEEASTPIHKVKDNSTITVPAQALIVVEQQQPKDAA